jgi:hypothetical protein
LPLCVTARLSINQDESNLWALLISVSIIIGSSYDVFTFTQDHA